MEFIETPIFTKRVMEILTDEEYRSLQLELLKNPKAGILISKGKGLRKYRWSASGKGKRGGARIIYYLYLLDEKIFMLFPYKKSDQEDLTSEQLKILINYGEGGSFMKDKDFQDLVRSIDQARDIHKGKLKPGRVFKFDPLEVKKIRIKLHVSQPEFAHMIGVNVSTLRNWEQKRTFPGGAARALLQIAAKKPRAVLEALYS